MSSTSSASSTNASSSSVDGLISGLNTTQIVDQLMSIERQPQAAIAAKRQTLTNQISFWQTLSTNVDAIGTAADILNLGTDWKSAKAVSSDTTIATVSTALGALPGTLNFTVQQLAQANIKSSSGYVSSTSAQAANANFLVAQGGSLGLGQMQGSAGLALGDHTFEVTQSSTGASQTGTVLADSVTVANGDTITVNISGAPQTINLTAGTYTRRGLADMITTASNGTLSASVNAAKGLTLTSAREGSAATLQITGGTNLSNVGLSAGSSNTGTDAIIKFDGVSNTVTDMNPNSNTPVVLNGQNSDTVGVTFIGGLKVNGVLTAKNVSYGDGTLSTIVSNINSAGSGVTATAIQVATGQYKLQLTSNAQGKVGSVSIDSRAFSGFLGTMDDLVAAGNAKVVVGSGANEYSLESASNSVSTFLPGVTLNLLKTSTDPVTVTIDKDYDGLADKVKALIDSVNTAMAYIKKNSGYDTTAKAAGTMLGDFTFTSVGDKLYEAIADSVSKSSFGAASNIGITLQSDGTFAFDRDTFVSQFKTNPEEMSKIFVEGGTSASNIDGSSPGIIDRLKSAQSAITGVQTGSLWNQLQSSNSQITEFDQEISDWDVRLAAKQQSIKAQFTQMEVLLGQMKNVSSQVGGQFARLSGG